MNSEFTERTSTNDLIRGCKRRNIPLNFIGFKDELKKVKVLPGAYIINLDDSTSGRGGTHWQATWIDDPLKESKTAAFFDSFQEFAPEEIEVWLKSGGIHEYVSNTIDIQDINRGYCGSFCLEFLEWMLANKTIPIMKRYQLFVNKFDFINPKKNAMVLKKLLNDNTTYYN